MIPLRKGETIHIVNGRQLCDRQYAQHRYNQGVDNCIEWERNKIIRLNEQASDDKAFRLAVLAEFVD